MDDLTLMRAAVRAFLGSKPGSMDQSRAQVALALLLKRSDEKPGRRYADLAESQAIVVGIIKGDV
jgi:hypothetical protein